MKVVIIGSGNVATVLGRKIQSSGHEILQVVSPNLEHARSLGHLLNCEVTNDFNNTDAHGELYLLALSDTALEEIHKVLQLHHSLALHTAGSVSKSVLKKVSTNFGVLYPLQSLRTNMKEIPEIPLLIDGNSADSLALIEDFASSISDNVRKAGDLERMKLHIAAVVTGNFTNHLYALAEDFCNQESIDFSLLIPLIMETVSRMRNYSPADMQTGPAIRRDQDTMQKHIKILKNYPYLRRMYRQISDSIREFHKRDFIP